MHNPRLEAIRRFVNESQRWAFRTDEWCAALLERIDQCSPSLAAFDQHATPTHHDRVADAYAAMQNEAIEKLWALYDAAAVADWEAVRAALSEVPKESRQFLRFAEPAISPPTPPRSGADNHHNAPLCPYCNPHGLMFAEPVDPTPTPAGGDVAERRCDGCAHWERLEGVRGVCFGVPPRSKGDVPAFPSTYQGNRCPNWTARPPAVPVVVGRVEGTEL